MKTASTPRKNVIHAEMLKTEVMERFLSGKSPAQVARELEVPEGTVKTYYRTALAELAEERKAYGELILQDQLMRIEVALTAMERIMEGDPKAAEAYLKGLDQRAKLLGLYPRDDGRNGGDVSIVLNFNGMPQSYRTPTLQDGITVEVVPEVVDGKED